MTHNDAKLWVMPRVEAGRFAKGGAGRPKGAKSKVNREALETIKSYGPLAMQKLYEAINVGERWAIEFVLTKILPVGRTVEFEDLTPDDITAALRAGDITLAEAKDASAALAKLAEVGELADIKDKLAELEQALNGKN